MLGLVLEVEGTTWTKVQKPQSRQHVCGIIGCSAGLKNRVLDVGTRQGAVGKG